MNATRFRGRAICAFALLQVLLACSSSQDSTEGAVSKAKAPLEKVDAVIEPQANTGTIVSTALAAQLASTDGNVSAVLSLVQPIVDDLPNEFGSAEFGPDGDTFNIVLNGVAVTRDELDANTENTRQLIAGQQLAREQARSAAWDSLGKRFGIESLLAEAKSVGSGSTELSLSAGQLRAIADENGGIIASMREHIDGTASNNTLASALSSIEVSTQAFPNGWNGNGQGIFLTDFDKPDTTASCVSTTSTRLELAAGTTGSNATHATQMVCLLQAAAPGAQVVYRTAYGNQGADIPSAITSHTPPVYVSSQSDNWSSGYNDGDRDFDNRVMTTRIAHFNSTGNQNSNVLSPAGGYNVLSVGAYDNGSSTMYANSNYINPSTGADKPEIVAPGVNIDISATYTGVTGTSVATPLAAGFAADLMTEYSFLRLQPALLKAYLMVNGQRIQSDGVIWGDKDGSGRLDYSNAQYGAAFWWNGTDVTTFTSDTDGDSRPEVVTTMTLGAGTYYVVVSWLIDGTYAYASGIPSKDVDLKVFNPGGTLLGTSNSSNQSFEGIKFTAATTGTYTFNIERYSNSGGSPNISMGMVVRAR